ncbi:hypothetical protein RQP46_000466 [Phenoliferia psychrophenolica]
MLARPRLRSAFALVSPRFFSSSPAALAFTKPSTVVDQLIEMTNTLVSKTEADALDDSTSLLKHLKPDTVISPGHLSPKYLLEPYLPRPNMALAYPLGPPVSEARTLDPFVQLGLDPRASPMNPWLRTDFCTTMGKIQPRGKTGLQRGSQRKLGKAVRRARSMGIVAVFGKSVPQGQ